MPPITTSALLDQIDAGGAVVLPTARAAAELRGAHDTRQRQRGLAAWEPAMALSWAQWAQGHWGDLVLAGAEQRLLLNPMQELALWREVVAEPMAGEAGSTGLGSPDALAQLASGAWQLAARYNATGRLRGSANTHDTRVFAAWADAFGRRCAGRGYLSAALLEAAAAAARRGRYAGCSGGAYAGRFRRGDTRAAGTAGRLRAARYGGRATHAGSCGEWSRSCATPGPARPPGKTS